MKRIGFYTDGVRSNKWALFTVNDASCIKRRDERGVGGFGRGFTNVLHSFLAFLNAEGRGGKRGGSQSVVKYFAIKLCNILQLSYLLSLRMKRSGMKQSQGFGIASLHFVTLAMT